MVRNQRFLAFRNDVQFLKREHLQPREIGWKLRQKNRPFLMQRHERISTFCRFEKHCLSVQHVRWYLVESRIRLKSVKEEWHISDAQSLIQPLKDMSYGSQLGSMTPSLATLLKSVFRMHDLKPIPDSNLKVSKGHDGKKLNVHKLVLRLLATSW